MNISQRLRTCAKHTGLDAVIELLQEAADEIDAMQTRAQVQDEPMAWNSIQIASWIGSKLMHEPSMFERATVCKFVRSLGRHPTLLKHSPKIHPAPSVPADIDALIHRVSVAICLSHSAWDLADARVLVLEILKQAAQPAQATQAEVTDGIRPEDFTVDVVVKPMGGFAPVNTQGVRVTHKPTGISVTCDAARSQHTNRHQAFEKLSAILAQQPATGEPVLVQHRKPVEGWKGETIGYTAWMDGKGLDWWPHRELYTHPAPSAPADVVRDAERYRWLRDHDHWPAPFSSSQEPEPVRGHDLDAAIDAAMLAAKDASA